MSSLSERRVSFGMSLTFYILCLFGQSPFVQVTPSAWSWRGGVSHSPPRNDGVPLHDPATYRAGAWLQSQRGLRYSQWE